MPTRLRTGDSKVYPVTEVFTGGTLNHDAVSKFGIPRLASTFAYSLFMANVAVSNRLSIGD